MKNRAKDCATISATKRNVKNGEEKQEGMRAKDFSRVQSQIDLDITRINLSSTNPAFHPAPHKNNIFIPQGLVIIITIMIIMVTQTVTTVRKCMVMTVMAILITIMIMMVTNMCIITMMVAMTNNK